MASLSLIFDLIGRDKGASESFRKVGDAAETTGKKAQKSAGVLGSSWKAAAGVIGGLALGSMFTGFVKDAAESARISRLTSAAIKSTGGVANITAKQVGDLATAISNKTAVDDEAIQSASNLLLTFTNVRNEVGRGNDVFNQATLAATNMTAALGKEPRQAAQMLGKALNDPIKGISALSRAGVQFTAQQREQIKTLVASGRTLDAQKIILGELETQFGGAAAAAADPMERLRVIAGNLGEQLGGYLLPVIGKLADWITTQAIPSVVRWAREFNERFGPIIRQVFGFVRDTVIPTIRDVIKWMNEHRGVVVGVAAAIGTLVAVTKVHAAVMAVQAVGGLVAYIKQGRIVQAVTKAWTAVQWLLNAALRANPIGIVITVIAALVAGIVIAYKKSETFRNIVKTAFEAVAKAGKWMWENVLRPAFEALKTAWNGLGTAIRWTWTNVVKPVFTAFQKIGETVRSAFATAVNGIRKLWDGLKNVLKAPIQAVIDVIWNNGIRKLWNTVNNLWGGDDLKEFRLARGGVLPGYTPGRDVHTFLSPTGGVLGLSGGEAVMRPEFTRALGVPTIDMLNQIARTQGEAGLRRMLGGGLDSSAMAHFATGGVIGKRDLGWLPPSWLMRLAGGPLGSATAMLQDYVTGERRALNGGGGHGLLSGAIGGTMTKAANSMWTWIKSKVSGLFESTDASLGPQIAPGQIGLGSGLGSTWQSIYAVVKRAFPEARINSAYRPGDPGYHGLGKAVDFGWGTMPGGNGNAGLAKINQFLYDNFGASMAELIYTGIGDNRANIKNGRPHTYDSFINATHRNHVHAAVYDQGGILPPGLTMAYNGTGRNEHVVKSDGQGLVGLRIEGRLDASGYLDGVVVGALDDQYARTQYS